MPKVVLCLGNPGNQYERTRHNIGFEVGKLLVSQFPSQKLGHKFKSILHQVTLNAQQVFVQFPDTYMNLSGEAIQPLLAYYKIPFSDLLVVYDDFDIPFGQLRFREKGSPGTHNGMKSVTQLLGTSAFPRLRFGIGPLPPQQRVADFVLQNFTQEEASALPELIAQSISGIQSWIHGDFDQAMRTINAVSSDQKKSMHETSE